MSECLVCSDVNAQHHYGTICCPITYENIVLEEGGADERTQAINNSGLSTIGWNRFSLHPTRSGHSSSSPHQIAYKKIRSSHGVSSCKGFFRRVYLSAKSLECYKGNCCEITKASRNSCRACRYKKCVQVGMNPNEIRGRADTSSPVALPEVFDEISTCSSSVRVQRKLTETDYSLALPSEFSILDEAEQLVNLYMNLDRFCETTSVTSSEVTRIDEDALITRMLDSTVTQLVEKTCPQCPRFTRSWKPIEYLDTYNFRRSWARDVVHLLDWANHFPTFKKLSTEDKVKVFIGRFTQFSLFTKCYRTYRESCSGLLFGCGNVFPYEREARGKIEDEYLRKLFSRLCDPLFADIIFPMAHLRLADSTYVLLKANIFLFEGSDEGNYDETSAEIKLYNNLDLLLQPEYQDSEDCWFTYSSLSPEGKAVIAREKARHRSALLAHLNSKKETFDGRLNQIIQVEHMMATIEAVSNFMDKEIQFLGVFGLLDMARMLIMECHVNKYKFNLKPV